MAQRSRPSGAMAVKIAEDHGMTEDENGLLTVLYNEEQFDKFLELHKIVAGWKHNKLYINGEYIEKPKQLVHVFQCASDRNKSSEPEKWCKTEDRRFGKNECVIECNQINRNFKYHFFEYFYGDRTEPPDKEAIEKFVSDSIEMGYYSYCPHLDEEAIFESIEKISKGEIGKKRKPEKEIEKEEYPINENCDIGHECDGKECIKILNTLEALNNPSKYKDSPIFKMALTMWHKPGSTERIVHIKGLAKIFEIYGQCKYTSPEWAESKKKEIPKTIVKGDN